MPKILGLDIGDRRIGVAIGDTDTKFAFTRPALVVDDWTQAWPLINELITNEQINLIIVGWPAGPHGQGGQQTARIEQFITELERRTNVPIARRNERGTTDAARQEQQSAGQARQRAEIDSLAAQLLVESYLTEPRR